MFFCLNDDILNGTGFEVGFIINCLKRASDEDLIADYLYFKSIDENALQGEADGVYLGDFDIIFHNYSNLLCAEMAERFF